MVTLEDANRYFDTEVLHNEPWVRSDDDRKQRALTQAENILYRHFRDVYSPEGEKLPNAAIYEQALWMLRQNSQFRNQEFGLVGQSVKGIQTQLKGNPISLISPEAQRVIDEDLEESGSGYPVGWWTL